MWMKANQMPSVENQFCDASECRKAPPKAGLFHVPLIKPSTHLGHISSLRSFLSLNDLEFDLIALGEGFETGSTDRAEVNKDVWSSLPRNEAKSLGVVEPFYRSSDACH